MLQWQMLYFSRCVDDPPPTRLSQLGVSTKSETATVYFVWEPPLLFARSDINDYILTATAVVGAQKQSKITTLTGSSLELLMSINYSITVQQRTKCMDVSDPVMILFEPNRGENCQLPCKYRNLDMIIQSYIPQFHILTCMHTYYCQLLIGCTTCSVCVYTCIQFVGSIL